MDRNNSGTISRNLDKQKPDANPNWPDYKGAATIGECEYWVSGWIKERQSDGHKFLSLAYTPKDEAQQRTAPTPMDDDDQYPF